MATAMRLLRSEIHPDYTRIEEIINIFVSLGFARFSIHDETDVYILTIAMPITDDELVNSENLKKSTIIYIDLIENDEEMYYCPKTCKKYYSYLFFENVSSRERIILDFLHRYFELYPDDIFWDCDKFFYTKKYIDKIYSKTYDPNWLYISPDSF